MMQSATFTLESAQVVVGGRKGTGYSKGSNITLYRLLYVQSEIFIIPASVNAALN
jgi:hypothetical protein